MNYSKLQEGKCPEIDCDSLLIPAGRFIECENCSFKMRKQQYAERIKPKEERESYKKKVLEYRKIDEYNKKKKERMKIYNEKVEKDRIASLKKMLRQGRITQEYYNSKINNTSI